MTDFEREDMELKSMMGEKFIDATQPISEAKPKKVTKTEVKTEVPNAEWHPVKPHTFIDTLWECVKWAAVFGGLNMLIFYWQLNGLMAESIAVPCMWVCCALAGYGVGLNIWRGSK